MASGGGGGDGGGSDCGSGAIYYYYHIHVRTCIVVPVLLLSGGTMDAKNKAVPDWDSTWSYRSGILLLR